MNGHVNGRHTWFKSIHNIRRQNGCTVFSTTTGSGNAAAEQMDVDRKENGCPSSSPFSISHVESLRRQLLQAKR